MAEETALDGANASCWLTHPGQPRSHLCGGDLGQGTSSQKGEMWGDPVPSSGSIHPHTLLTVTRQRDLAGGDLKFGGSLTPSSKSPPGSSCGSGGAPSPTVPTTAHPTQPWGWRTSTPPCPAPAGGGFHPGVPSRCSAPWSNLGMGPAGWWCRRAMNSWQGRKKKKADFWPTEEVPDQQRQEIATVS